ncbi:MAG: hypothetical protein II120_03210 [Bacteroidales bacterium]|nr:hypothetical protein [Bacteroidales bacterium]
MKEHTTDSQCSAILEHLKKGLSITPIEALSLCGCFRLAARIHDLRHKQGFDNIVTERVLTRSGKYVAQYRLAI